MASDIFVTPKPADSLYRRPRHAQQPRRIDTDSDDIADGLTWTEIGSHVAASSISEGPGGVLSIGWDAELAEWRVWRLVERR
jgi:hypothetical protein